MLRPSILAICQPWRADMMNLGCTNSITPSAMETKVRELLLLLAEESWQTEQLERRLRSWESWVIMNTPSAERSSSMLFPTPFRWYRLMKASQWTVLLCLSSIHWRQLGFLNASRKIKPKQLCNPEHPVSLEECYAILQKRPKSPW